MEYFFSVSFNYRLPHAIGFVFPSSCFCHNLTPRQDVLTSVVSIFLYLLRSLLDMGLRSPFVLFFRSLHLLRLPNYTFSFSSVVFGVYPFFPGVPRGLLPCIGLLREMNSVLFDFPESLILKWLPLFFRSVLFRFPQIGGPTTLFDSCRKFGFSFIRTIYGFFQFLQNVN